MDTRWVDVDTREYKMHQAAINAWCEKLPADFANPVAAEVTDDGMVVAFRLYVYGDDGKHMVRGDELVTRQVDASSADLRWPVAP